jgi:hypothetical protein
MRSQNPNLFLSGLSQKSEYLLAPHFVAVSLPLQTILYEADVASPLRVFPKVRCRVSRCIYDWRRNR